MMLHIHFVKVDHETLLVIGSLGIQLSSSYASGREVTNFIEMSKIKDIVINEAVYLVRGGMLWQRKKKYSTTSLKCRVLCVSANKRIIYFFKRLLELFKCNLKNTKTQPIPH